MQLKPETERLVKEEISRGHFESVDEIIAQGVAAWHEKHQPDTKPRKKLERSAHAASLCRVGIAD